MINQCATTHTRHVKSLRSRRNNSADKCNSQAGMDGLGTIAGRPALVAARMPPAKLPICHGSPGSRYCVLVEPSEDARIIS